MKIVVCKENTCSFEVKAPKDWELEKIKIDGGVIVDSKTERCDYAVTASNTNEKHTFIYVELKGTDLRKAISQLETTINNLKLQHANFQHKHARAVCSRIIPGITSEAQVAAKRFLNKYNFNLRWHSQQGSFLVKA